MASSIAQYLRSATITSFHNPTYDDKGRLQPFGETPHQRRERCAFVESLQWRRNVASWMNDQQHPHSTAPDARSSSTSSSESSSPRTPASPLNTPHVHVDTAQHQKMKTVEALDAELAKLVLASRQVAPPQHRQSRNYKNLHLPNTTAQRYQSQIHATALPSQQPRVQVPVSTPTRGVFDSLSYPSSAFSTYPLHHNDVDGELASGEPYIFYSSSSSLPTPSSRSPSTTLPSINTSTIGPQAAGIGEFPYPASSPSSSSSRPSHSHSISLALPAQLASPSSSLSPRTITSSN